MGNGRYTGTAYWIAAARARESSRPDRLFDDPYAEMLAGDIGRTILARSEAASGMENPFLPVRTRFFDDLITAASGSVRNLVLLGAGLDTRAFRLRLAPDLVCYEVDQPELFDRKEPMLESAGARPACDRRLVAADLSGEWETALIAAGFDAGAATLWIAEGLFFYLSDSAARSLLATTGNLSAPGSLLATDLFGTGLLESPQMQSYLQWLRNEHLPAPFVTDDATSLIREYGWRMKEITMVGQSRANYGRFAARSGTQTTPIAENNRAYLIEAMV